MLRSVVGYFVLMLSLQFFMLGFSWHTLQNTLTSAWYPLLPLSWLWSVSPRLGSSAQEILWVRRLCLPLSVWLLLNLCNLYPLGAYRQIPGKLAAQESRAINKQGTLYTLNSLETDEGTYLTTVPAPLNTKINDPILVEISPRLYGDKVISIKASTPSLRDYDGP